MSLAGSAFTDSGAVRTQRLAADKRTAPEHCYGVRAAIHPYRLLTWELQDRRSAPHADRTPLARGHSCHWGKYVLSEWRTRTRSARVAWKHWREEVNDPTTAIMLVFGEYGQQALAVASCESGRGVYAHNGQYLGMFQMGSYARSAFGHSWTALGQARAAYSYFIASGRDWSPWSCKPW